MNGQGFLSDEKLFTICQWMMVTKQLFFETKKVTIFPLLKFQFSNKSLKINGFKPPISFGIEIALNILGKIKTNISDKAKPRVIVGRKATGPEFSG